MTSLQALRPLKFRKVSIQTNKGFFCLDRYVSRKITSLQQLYSALARFTTEEQTHALRVYSSLNEFLNAKELRSRHEIRKNRNYLLSSWMVIESDRPYYTAQYFYIYTYNRLLAMGYDPYIVATGSRSIHLWFEFDYIKYLNQSQQKMAERIGHPSLNQRHYFEMQARYNFVNYHLYEHPDYKRFIDHRVIYDLLRQVPVCYTFNEFSRKWITPLTQYYLYANWSEILQKCTVSPTRPDIHHQLDLTIESKISWMMAEGKI